METSRRLSGDIPNPGPRATQGVRLDWRSEAGREDQRAVVPFLLGREPFAVLRDAVPPERLDAWRRQRNRPRRVPWVTDRPRPTL